MLLRLPKDKSADACDAIEQLLRDAERLLDVRLAVHDRAAVFHGCDGVSLLQLSRRYHSNAYCEMGRFERGGWDARCKGHCLTNVNVTAHRREAAFTHACWKGVREIVVPIRREGVHLATLFAGQFRAIGNDAAPPRGLDRKLQVAWEGLPAVDDERAAALGRVLTALGAGLLALIDQANRLASPTGDRATRVRRFIHYHAHQPALRLDDLAEELDLSASRTSHLVKELFGEPFQTVLQAERLARARAMLLTTHYPVRTIAARTGFASEFYFSRVFRAAHGVPPAHYRRLHQSD